MLTIDDPEIERFLREEAERTGTEPVDVLRQFLPRPAEPSGTVTPEERARRRAVIREAQERFARLPILDARPMDEILGYGDDGLPT